MTKSEYAIRYRLLFEMSLWIQVWFWIDIEWSMRLWQIQVAKLCKIYLRILFYKQFQLELIADNCFTEGRIWVLKIA